MSRRRRRGGRWTKEQQLAVESEQRDLLEGVEAPPPADPVPPDQSAPPDDPSVQLALGILLYRRGLYAEASAMYLEARELGGS